jgi:hypothetical protein
MGVKFGLSHSEQGAEENIWTLEGGKMAGGWRTLHNEELHNLYDSPDIVRVFKTRRMRCAGYVAHVRTMRIHTKVWFEDLKGTDHSENQGVDGRIIL